HGLERAGSIGHGQAEGAQGAQGGGFGGRGDADEDASYDQEDDDGQGQDILQGKRQALPDRHFFGLVSRGGVGIDQTSDDDIDDEGDRQQNAGDDDGDQQFSDRHRSDHCQD